MPRRDDDDLDVVMGLSVDQDDADHFRHKERSKGRRKTDEFAEAKASQKQTPAAPVKKSGGMGWLTAILILALMGGSGWLAQQVIAVQKQLADTDSSLQLARTRIDVLGQQVYATGSSFNETGNTIEKKFSKLDSEIRKLWDVSNKKNKASIGKNTKLVAEQGKQIKALESGLKNTAEQTKKSFASVENISSSQTKFDKKLDQVSNEYRSENTSFRAIQDDLSEQVLLVRGELEQILARLNKLPKNLSTRLEENDEAIKAIDSTRRQLVDNVTQLQSKVNQLQLTIGQNKPVAPVKP